MKATHGISPLPVSKQWYGSTAGLSSRLSRAWSKVRHKQLYH